MELKFDLLRQRTKKLRLRCSESLEKICSCCKRKKRREEKSLRKLFLLRGERSSFWVFHHIERDGYQPPTELTCAEKGRLHWNSHWNFIIAGRKWKFDTRARFINLVTLSWLYGASTWFSPTLSKLFSWWWSTRASDDDGLAKSSIDFLKGFLFNLKGKELWIKFNKH